MRGDEGWVGGGEEEKDEGSFCTCLNVSRFAPGSPPGLEGCSDLGAEFEWAQPSGALGHLACCSPSLQVGRRAGKWGKLVPKGWRGSGEATRICPAHHVPPEGRAEGSGEEKPSEAATAPAVFPSPPCPLRVALNFSLLPSPRQASAVPLEPPSFGSPGCLSIFVERARTTGHAQWRSPKSLRPSFPPGAFRKRCSHGGGGRRRRLCE